MILYCIPQRKTIEINTFKFDIDFIHSCICNSRNIFLLGRGDEIRKTGGGVCHILLLKLSRGKIIQLGGCEDEKQYLKCFEG